MEPMKNVQVEGHLMFAEPHDLFGNLDELCYVRFFSCLMGESDNDNGKYCKYVCITTNKPDTKFNPNPNPNPI